MCHIIFSLYLFLFLTFLSAWFIVNADITIMNVFLNPSLRKCLSLNLINPQTVLLTKHKTCKFLNDCNPWHVLWFSQKVYNVLRHLRYFVRNYYILKYWNRFEMNNILFSNVVVFHYVSSWFDFVILIICGILNDIHTDVGWHLFNMLDKRTFIFLGPLCM